jgi:hypothetical protein
LLANRENKRPHEVKTATAMYAYRETAARFRTRGKDTRKNGKLEYRIYPLADYSPIRSLFDGNPDSNPPITSSEASNIGLRRLDIG